ncbi:hypothetical protein GGI26_005983 [Coemansia sp. RSA 1358]|uniref:Uncharacterized protein n=1 Tax=Coemansia umbellata TaxID=1424467 RepID=A0ABQ8PEY4_9FUNG|nr:hypothetical protein EDC05_005891 [Coemansia umbellata]KAJ2619242.1 hypothetical protein GGI26_005983 [Coemansia sp. RSA 1358]
MRLSWICIPALLAFSYAYPLRVSKGLSVRTGEDLEAAIYDETLNEIAQDPNIADALDAAENVSADTADVDTEQLLPDQDPTDDAVYADNVNVTGQSVGSPALPDVTVIYMPQYLPAGQQVSSVAMAPLPAPQPVADSNVAMPPPLLPEYLPSPPTVNVHL